jgi:sugar/nucleoside kinase (ribokinase family)
MAAVSDPAGSVLIVGSVALDTVETPRARRERVLGGAATYASVAAALYAPVSIVGVVGHDFPVSYIRTLIARGINTDGLEIRAGKTFFWEGRYAEDPNDRTTITTELGVFGEFEPAIPESHRSHAFVFLANIDPDLQLAVLDQMERPQFVCVDTMNYWIAGKRAALAAVLRRVDMALVNDSEARMLAGATSMVECARRIVGMGPRYLAIKKGEHGSLLLDDEGWFMCPPILVENVVDPTGAGDTFAGAMIGSLAAGGGERRALRRAVMRGTAAASFAIEDFSVDALLRADRDRIEERVGELAQMIVYD